ncbi:unnamed protein product [Cylicocyclus nassatus]|uniref:Secreted protein n=1 Tax=Cylicocyclus nassatus TaxID=53992 RepID=A0AA36H756_CYLNA|nr:unnamed protein product [Cylicocyclus nassatus]
MRAVLLLVAFGVLISSSAAGVVNRKERSSPLGEPFNDSLNTVTPSSTGVPDPDLQKLYEFFRIIENAMEAQTTENIRSALDKYPVWDLIGHILNGTLEIETTTLDRSR